MAGVLAVVTALLLVPGRTIRWRPPAVLMPVPGAIAAPFRLASGAVMAMAPLVLLGVGPLGIGVGALVGPTVTVVLGRMESGAARRRREMVAAQLPDTWQLLAMTLSAGLPLGRAMAEVADCLPEPVSGLIAEPAAALAAGVDLPVALADWADDPGRRRVARDLVRASESGAALATTLTHHAEQARRRQAAVVLTRARAVGVRSVLPMMVCQLPAFLLVGVVPIVASGFIALLE